MLAFILILLISVGAIYYFFFQDKRTVSRVPVTPKKWILFLEKNVTFYRNLDSESRLRFEHDVHQFLSEVRITGVKTEVELADRLLIASSAVIPLFGFSHWHYSFLDEVLLYPSSFDRNFQLNNPNEIITGMVGTGSMEGKMILSKPALHAGFQIGNDKRNVGIHEFVHLLDKEDGEIDGIPPGLESELNALPWLELIRDKTRTIQAKRSDIDDYAATNRQEFFAVASEYFFERPHLLEIKHPLLYKTLSEVFNQDLVASTPKDGFLVPKEPGRNDPCPCGSGQKYKRCCLE